MLDTRSGRVHIHHMSTKVARVVTAIRAQLGPHVLRPDWRKRRPDAAVASWGCCYIAAEAVYHALGGESAGLKVMHVNHEDSPHWYLVDAAGAPVDPTVDQFATPVPYARGKGKGFLTLQPSKRAQALLVAAGLI